MSLLNARLRFSENSLLAVDRLSARLGRSGSLANHLRTGVQGEEAAFFFLRRHGYVVTARRWHSASRPGDIDLIAWESETLCFVEVKTRTSHAVATAQAAVDEHKRRTLRRVARAYLRLLPQGVRGTATLSVRFDILSIYMDEARPADYQLFRGAFDWS